MRRVSIKVSKTLKSKFREVFLFILGSCYATVDSTWIGCLILQSFWSVNLF